MLNVNDYFVKIPVVILLFLIFYQDLKSRSVHLFLLAGILLLGLIHALFFSSLHLSEVYKILFFLLLNISGLFLYYSIKNKKMSNPIDSGIGLGDLLFFIVIVPFFAFRSYLIFFITGLIFSLIFFGLSNLLWKKAKTVPLAGCLAFYLGSIFIVEISLSENFLIYG